MEIETKEYIEQKPHNKRKNPLNKLKCVLHTKKTKHDTELKIYPFNQNTFSRVQYVAEYRRQKGLTSTYKIIVEKLSKHQLPGDGYHLPCYKKFVAVRKLYKEVPNWAENLEKPKEEWTFAIQRSEEHTCLSTALDNHLEILNDDVSIHKHEKQRDPLEYNIKMEEQYVCPFDVKEETDENSVPEETNENSEEEIEIEATNLGSNLKKEILSLQNEGLIANIFKSNINSDSKETNENSKGELETEARNLGFKLRKEILSLQNDAENSDPKIFKSNINAPVALKIFFQKLLGGSEELTDHTKEYIDTITQDALFMATKGAIVPSKHIILGLAFKNLVGSNEHLLDLLHRHGYIVDRRKIKDLEASIVDLISSYGNK